MTPPPVALRVDTPAATAAAAGWRRFDFDRGEGASHAANGAGAGAGGFVVSAAASGAAASCFASSTGTRRAPPRRAFLAGAGDGGSHAANGASVDCMDAAGRLSGRLRSVQRCGAALVYEILEDMEDICAGGATEPAISNKFFHFTVKERGMAPRLVRGCGG
jgi:hypothetical protein